MKIYLKHIDHPEKKKLLLPEQLAGIFLNLHGGGFVEEQTCAAMAEKELAIKSLKQTGIAETINGFYFEDEDYMPDEPSDNYDYDKYH